MKRACIIIPYYGKWPPYLKLFLKSCSHNPELTILIFTDLIPPSSHPGNVRFYSYSLAQIKSSLDEILNIDSGLTTPYKLCDVRPAYGLIFSQYLGEFDFWGWGDLDVLYGRTNDFDLHRLFTEYDVISFRKRWLSGSFCFVRNNDFLNRLFLESPDKEEIFSSTSYKGFDEISLCWGQIRNISLEEMKWPSDNFTRVVMEAAKNEYIKPYFNDHIKESIPEDGYLLWQTGKITDHLGQSYIHYHFITEKRKPYFVYPDWNEIPEKFYIDRTGFYTGEEFKKRNKIAIKRMLFTFPTMVGNILNRIAGKLSK